MKRVGHKMCANASALIELCRLLNDSAYTKQELMDLLGCAPNTVTKWVRILQHKKLVYVCEWRPGLRGCPAAVWAWGYECKDAPRPKPMEPKLYSQRYKAKKRGVFGLQGV